jgi:hypothetical protein
LSMLAAEAIAAFAVLRSSAPPRTCRPCSTEVVALVASSILQVLRAAEGGMNVVPALMEEVQDGVSVLYYLLQRFGVHLATAEGDRGQAAIVQAARVALRVLQVCAQLPPLQTWVPVCRAVHTRTSRPTPDINQARISRSHVGSCAEGLAALCVPCVPAVASSLLFPSPLLNPN